MYWFPSKGQMHACRCHQPPLGWNCQFDSELALSHFPTVIHERQSMPHSICLQFTFNRTIFSILISSPWELSGLGVLSFLLEFNPVDYFCVRIWALWIVTSPGLDLYRSNSRVKNNHGFMCKTHIVCFHLYVSRAQVCVHEGSSESISDRRLYSMGELKKSKISTEISAQMNSTLKHGKRRQIVMFIITESALLMT